MDKEKQSMNKERYNLDLEQGTQSYLEREHESEISLLASGHEKAQREMSQLYPKVPGLWPSSFSEDYCCIYRVPNRLRRVNPEAYTPQMILIGPIHHSKIAQAEELSKTNSRYLDYLNMELHKKRYVNDIANIYGNQTVEELRNIIKEDEKIIRGSYAERTDWIGSDDFLDLILHDSVFILWFFIQFTSSKYQHSKKEDILYKEPCLLVTILEDLLLLENQLPYVLLEKLFESFSINLETKKTFRYITLGAFGFKGKIKDEVKFLHFTDLARRVRVVTLGLPSENEDKLRPPSMMSKIFNNADELDRAGVKFQLLHEEDKLSMGISFENGILKMPFFRADENTERVTRNLIALEQCHYPFSTHVCDYMEFLDLLIDTEKDVELLVKKGIIKNWLEHEGLVADMVNKMCLGVVTSGLSYYHIAEKLSKHYDNRFNRSFANLRRVYFKDLWTGTATVAAVVILVLTLIGTVASVLQITQKDDTPTSSSS